MTRAVGFEPPPYPYDRLDEMRAVAARFDGGAVDLSIGTPGDPPPGEVVEALASSGAERGYPPSVGNAEFRVAASRWVERRFGVSLPTSQLGACIGTKELVASLPHALRLRSPHLDTVLYPAISYPSYAMGATLAGARAVPVAVDDQWRLDLSSVDPVDADRALCLWVNTPGNPTGGLDDLGAAVAWARANDVLLASDECYAEFTWDAPFPGLTDGPARTAMQHGTDGVLAVHSLSKRSNLAGLRVGFYAGDAELVHYLQELRKHSGMMVPGPVQAAAVVAFDDDRHVDAQRAIYRRRLVRMAAILERLGLTVELPGGAFYLWVRSTDGDGWSLTSRLADELGIVASPGEFYGPAGAAYVRLAMVCSDAQLDLVESRAPSPTPAESLPSRP